MQALPGVPNVCFVWGAILTRADPGQDICIVIDFFFQIGRGVFTHCCCAVQDRDHRTTALLPEVVYICAVPVEPIFYQMSKFLKCDYLHVCH